MSNTPIAPSAQDLFLVFDRTRCEGAVADTPSHLHAHYELLLSTEAVETSALLEDKEFHLDRPFALLISPYCVHRFWTPHTETRIEIHFGNRVLDRHPGIRPLLGRLLQNRSTVLLRPPSFVMSQWIALCRQMQMLEATPYAGECLLEALLYLLTDHLPPARRQSGEHHATSYISEVVRYIAEHLSEKLTAPMLADAFFVSRDKLNRDFKQYTSVTLGKFISTVRLERAKELLETREQHKLSIKEISEACGFESDVYFYSFFKQSVGVTPRQYEEDYRRARGF